MAKNNVETTTEETATTTEVAVEETVAVDSTEVSPHLGDVEQTKEELQEAARQEALVNHAAENAA